MYQAMAVPTAIDDLGAVHCARHSTATVHQVAGVRRWRGRQMAALAQERLAHLQHAVVIGTVGIVAVAAVVAYRRMLPEERAALFCMALITAVIGVRGRECGLSGAAVGIVATGATHLSSTCRYVGRAVHLGALPDMAVAADLLRHFFLIVMHAMAGGAGQAVGLVGTATPVLDMHAALMAAQAGVVDPGGVFRGRLETVQGQCATFLVVGYFHMASRGAMTGLAASRLLFVTRCVGENLIVGITGIGLVIDQFMAFYAAFAAVIIGKLRRSDRRGEHAQ